MSGSDHTHGRSDATNRTPEDESQSDPGSDHADGIILYALGTYGFAFLFVPGLVNGLIQDSTGRWLVVSAVMLVLVAWGVALVGLVQFRVWGLVGSLAFHALAFLLSLLSGSVLAVGWLLLTGFYVLSHGSLFTDSRQADSGTT